MAQLVPISRLVPDSVAVIPSIEFTRYENLSLKLDLYRPVDFDGTIPVIILIQGGGLQNGQKSTFGPLAAALAQHGLAAASIDYRGVQTAPFPASVFDIKSAIRWLRANASAYSLNPDAIGLLGGSYGGLMSAYVGLTADIPELEGPGGNLGVSSKINAIVGFSALTELESMTANANNFINSMLGSSFVDAPELWQFASPLSHVGANSPPALLIASNVDTTVPFQQSLILADAYGENNLEFELHLLPGAHHAFWNYTQWFEDVMNESAKFFHKHLD